MQAGTEIQFTATGYTASGSAQTVTVDWLATGGSIMPDGRFRGEAAGNYQVTARVRGHETVADSARVGVWQNGIAIVEVIVFPDSAVVEAGDVLQADAVLRLSDGTLAPNAVVTWTANGGSIDGQGHFSSAVPGTYALTAHAVNGMTGTATVLVLPKVRTLSSISVSPSVSDVVPGQSTAFISTAFWSDGTSGPGDVVWSATGGTVSADGEYTAGSAGGLFVVVARHRQGTLADTARVNVIPPSVVELSVTPGSAALEPGATQVFSVIARLSDDTWRNWPVTWQATSGTITPSGLYTAGTAAGTFKVIATAVGAPIADTVSVTVAQTPATLLALHLNPSTVTVPTGQARQFSVTADWSDGSHSLPALTWSATGGSITGSGLYGASGSGGSFVVVATGPGGVSDTSFVTVVAPVLTQLDLAPGTSSVLVGQTVQFSVSGLMSDGSPVTPAVTWSVSGGTMNGSGLFTAGSSPGTYEIVATAQGATLADTSLVTIGIPAPVLVSLVLTPASAALAPGAIAEFNIIGTWSDGTTGRPAVVYSGTGGSMAGKMYTAGSVPGNYRVIAREAGGTLADTSSVLITSPVTLVNITLLPDEATVLVGTIQQFNVSATWSNGTTSVPPLTWTATGGTVTGTGRYTAGTTPGIFRVIARHQTGTRADTAVVTVTPGAPPPPILTDLTVSPKPASIAPGATTQFTATAGWSDGSTTLPALTWSATGGTISGSGFYTAGSTSGSYRVIVAGGGLADTTAVTINAAPAPTLTAVVVTPASVSLASGGIQQFAASGQYSDGTSGAVTVTWSATGGVVTSAGRYTAGTAAGTYRVIARQQTGTKADTSTVTITAAPAPTLTSVVVTPGVISLLTGGVQQFSAAGQYSDGSTGAVAVTWTGTGGLVTSTGLYTAGVTTGTYRVIATQQGGTKADTAAVTITVLPAKTLTGVVVTPNVASLLTGGVQQFSAAGQYSDGSTGAVAVTWSGTGGLVTSTGLYTAGMSTGTYRVIATQQGGTKADTAVITVSLAPPPIPPSAMYPNQPSGMTWSNTRGFDAKAEVGWVERGDANFSIVSDPTAPVSPSNVGQALFAPGLTPGSGPISTTITGLNGSRTLYVAFWMKLSSNFYGGSNNVNKVLHAWIGGTNKAVISVVGQGNGPLQAQLRLQSMGVFTPAQTLSWNAATNMNTASSTVKRGQWQHWEVVLVANTPGLADGEIHYWLDGIKIGQYTSLVGFSSASETGSLNAWSQLTWNPTWGGSGATVPANQYMWIDHIRISGK